MSRTKINPISRSDQTLSRYTPWYTLRSSVFFLSTSGFSDYSVFFVNIQRIPKHDFPRALFCRAALLKHVLVATAVSTTRRALSPCDVEGSLDKPVNFDNQHLSQAHWATVRWYDSPCVFRVCSRSHCCLHNATSSLSPCDVEGSLDKPVNLAYRSHMRRPFDGTIRRLYIGHTFAASQ